MNQPQTIETAIQIPPNNIEYEALALGCVLLQGEHQEHWREASTLLRQLKTILFYDVRHQKIFQTLQELDADGLPLSMVSFAAHVNRGLVPTDLVASRWEDYGGPLYVSQLPDKPPAPLMFGAFVEQLYELADRRRVVAAGAHANDTSAPLSLPQRLERPRANQARHVKDIIPAVIEQWETARKHRGACTGVRSGLVDLDRLTSGWQKQNLIVIGARPSQGKTAMLIGFAAHAALEDRVPTVFFTVESSAVEIVKRFECMVSRTNQMRWRDGLAADADFQAVTTATLRFMQAPLWIVECQTATASEIAQKARELKAAVGIGLICVDYLQKLKPETREEKRTYEVAQISEGLKNMARELDVPVITAAQLNREWEKAKGRAPSIGDLSDSSQIEKDADIIGLLYKKDDERKLLIAKFRDGPISVINLVFLDHCARFESKSKNLPYKDE